MEPARSLMLRPDPPEIAQFILEVSKPEYRSPVLRELLRFRQCLARR